MISPVDTQTLCPASYCNISSTAIAERNAIRSGNNNTAQRKKSQADRKRLYAAHELKR